MKRIEYNELDCHCCEPLCESLDEGEPIPPVQGSPSDLTKYAVFISIVLHIVAALGVGFGLATANPWLVGVSAVFFLLA